MFDFSAALGVSWWRRITNALLLMNSRGWEEVEESSSVYVMWMCKTHNEEMVGDRTQLLGFRNWISPRPGFHQRSHSNYFGPVSHFDLLLSDCLHEEKRAWGWVALSGGVQQTSDVSFSLESSSAGWEQLSRERVMVARRRRWRGNEWFFSSSLYFHRNYHCLWS